MDKVQFNQQKVGMRKVVKQSKVRVIHQLTRQIQKLQKKSGSAQQVEKNKRRAERLGAEIEVIKTFSIDDITKAAIECKKTLEEVCKQPNASAKDRALARLTNYGHIQSKVAEFKDMVEPEFYQIGKKKKRKLKKEHAEAKYKKEEKEDQETNSEDEDSEDEDSEDNSDKEPDPSDGSMKEQLLDSKADEAKSANISPVDRKKTPNRKKDAAKSPQTIRTTLAAVDVDDIKPVRKHKPKSSFFASGDADDDNDGLDQDEGISSGDDKVTSKNVVKDFKEFSSELKTNESVQEFLRSRTAEGKKTLDSVFMGSLSDRKPLGAAQNKKNRAGQRQRLRKGKMNDPSNKKKFGTKTNESKQTLPRNVPMVDRPNVVKSAASEEKMVPGINCFRNKMNPGKGTEEPKQAPKAVEKLHPSWEAKRKKKEQEAKPVAFEGKKITFDDD